MFHRYHDNHRLNNKFVLFTDSSNEVVRISSTEIEVLIALQLKIEVKSIGNERETKNRNMEVINNNRAKELPIKQGICATGFDTCQ